MQERLTAWIDGELSVGRSARVRAHVDGCALCAAEADSLRITIERQRPALGRLMAVHGLDVEAMGTRLRRALAVQPDQGAGSEWSGWRDTVARRLWRPVVLAGAAMAAALVLLFLFAGGPDAVLMPLGVESPPVAVSRQPDLFKNYPLIQHLDALENFDTVESTPLEDDQAPQRG